MSLPETVALLALTVWAIYRQTVTSQVPPGLERFKLAIIYAAVGLIIGGFDTPTGPAGWGLIVIGLLLSFVVGLARGRLTRVWIDDNESVWRRGTALTVILFLGLIAAKVTMGTLAYMWRVDGAGFGEILVMIAIMIAVQAQIIHRRAVAAPHRPVAMAATHLGAAHH